MGLDDLVYGLYERRLAHDLVEKEIPRHVGVILDGNRRWASEQGSSSAAGHRAGAAKISEFLQWCDELGVDVVTLWLLSTDNLNRPADELDPLLRIIEDAVAALAASGSWVIRHVGSRDPAARTHAGSAGRCGANDRRAAGDDGERGGRLRRPAGAGGRGSRAAP